MASPDRKISVVNNDFHIVASALRPLERSGFMIRAYSTYQNAWRHREQIGETDLLILETVLPPGHDASDEIRNIAQHDLGLRLLQDLRTEGFQLPAVFWTAGSVTHLPTDMKQTLNATLLRMPTRPSELYEHVCKRLSLPY